ncbi:diguanylate cyclase domain-containing protein [Kineococcus sp. SYSU DK002]|uniref:diguanylate cyclase domain-containing protein n=1 Tax=Kineococcus sp. SYSU DK002 TaxID=3383123 RepID=UPI003D7E67F6
MTHRPAPRTSARALGRSLLFTALFAGAVYLGRLTLLDGSPVALVWPAAGVAAAWMCGSRRRVLDAALLTAATIVVNALTGAAPALLAGFVLTNVGQALLFAWVRDRWSPRGGPQPASPGSRQLAVLLATTAVACAGGTLGGLLVVAATDGPLTWVGTAVWFTRNFAGIVLVAPVLLRLEARVPVRVARRRFAALELLLAVTTSLLAYGAVFWTHGAMPLAFLPLAATIWLALRFDTTIVVAVDLVVAAVAVIGTLHGTGPFSPVDDDALRVLLVQVHAGFLACLGLALAVGRDERDELVAHLRAARADAERRDRFTQAVLSSVSAGMVVADPQGRVVVFNDTARDWHGLDADPALDPEGHPANYRLFAADGVTPLPAAGVPLARTLAEGEVSGVEMVVVGPGGRAVPVECNGRTVTDDDGTVLGAVVAMHDLTTVKAREQALARANAQLEAHSLRVERLAAASRAVLTADDPRRAVCAAAVEIAGADGAFLAQPDGSGRLVSTATAGLPDGFAVDLDVRGDVSLTLTSYLSCRPLFVPDVPSHPGASSALVAGCGSASGAWQPVVDADGRVLGVLAVIWHEPLSGLDPTTAAVLTGLAAEAAHAFSRADLLAQLARAADHDALTGVVNRRRWDELARQEVARAGQTGTALTFAMLDLDHFKRYNDTRGHLAGDELLREFARAAGAQLREGDTLARWGGEEFALMLPGCTGDDAVDVVDRIRSVVPDGQTCTAGVCQWVPGEEPEEAIARADRALYRGKLTRDSTVVAGPAPSAVADPAR